MDMIKLIILFIYIGTSATGLEVMLGVDSPFPFSNTALSTGYQHRGKMHILQTEYKADSSCTISTL